MTKTLLCLIIYCASGSIYANNSNSELTELFQEYQIYRENIPVKVDHPDPVKRIGRLPDIRTKTILAHKNKLESFLEIASKFKLNELSEQESISLKLFNFALAAEIEQIDFQNYLMPLEGDTGFYFDLIRLPEVTSIKNENTLKFYFETLQDFPNYLAQWRSHLESAIQQKKLLPSIVLVDFDKPLDSLVVEDVTRNPLLKPVYRYFENAKPNSLDGKSFELLIQDKVQPSIKAFQQFLVQNYIPKARQSIAISDIPNGKDFYQSQIRYYTTLDLSAEDIHTIGLNEVARIRKEMDAVIKQSGFKGSFLEFIDFLRTDPQFYADSPEQLLKEASFIAKKMDGQLPRFFKRLPRQPYGIDPVPESIAPRYTTGRYVSAPLDSNRSGSYWVNTYALDKRPLYVLEALTLHEAVPGHHLQSALSQELDNLPEFRRKMYLSAFGEGWALYCEKLGKEAGFYTTPYNEFGRLSYEMWRAIRLVVDTGIHAKGWSREKAIDYMENNTALSKHNIATEIDRYIAWPAQALSYKLGEIKILELRSRAEAQLGEAFDLREFHDQILKNGAMTLPLLDQQIDRWIESQIKRTNH